MTASHLLTGLTVREEIADTIARACLGLDRNDKHLYDSAWASDPEISINLNGNVLNGPEGIKQCFEAIGPMDSHHFVSGIRVDVEEDANVASLTSNAMAKHYRAGEGLVPNAEYLLAGTAYDIRVVKETSGHWKMKSWIIKVIWAEGNWDVMPSF
ncbi:LAME_0H00122g1_1 [Lachancea meyersii CBS 8951]|uniref:LAME_0F00122g1_1 n=1 Tax=Lachancea meyersii CBS 8951 TaxID=1266667 RepID=A0A1G4KD26_9SACH|nr:LAME_0F00122g1_1 [Lachancea meyersii CBS 8951]SCV02419.1 LAME_0H00122g1_1 [Lachancea meyersii CBS 8951]